MVMMQKKIYQSCRARFSLLDNTIHKQIQADYFLVIGLELWQVLPFGLTLPNLKRSCRVAIGPGEL